MDKILYVIRGCPGAGKSTLARQIADEVWEADQYFDVFNSGVFNPKLLHQAHAWCRDSVESSMIIGTSRIAVANTFTRMFEMEPYFELAEKHGYKVFVMVVENHHGNKSIHQVPSATIDKMIDRFEHFY